MSMIGENSFVKNTTHEISSDARQSFLRGENAIPPGDFGRMPASGINSPWGVNAPQSRRTKTKSRSLVTDSAGALQGV